MGSLSMLVPHREQRRVRATAGRLFQAASQAGDSSPLCRRTSFVIAAIAPEVPIARLSVLVRYGVWSVALDDRLDGAGVDPTSLDQLDRAVAVVTEAGAPVRPADPLLAALADIVDDLARYDRSGACVGRFTAALRDAVAAGIEHARLGRAVAAGERAPPTLSEYLAVAARTANYHSFGYALLAVGPGRATDAQLARIGPALGHGARALRLRNDLRSVERDRAEQTLNVLSLRTASGEPVTAACVEAEIGRQVRAHHAALAALGGQRRPAVRLLTRSLQVAVDLYRLADLRPDDQAAAQSAQAASSAPPYPPAGAGRIPRQRRKAASRADWTTRSGR